jgi:hypothetical protein
MVYRGKEQLTYSSCSGPADREQYMAHTIKRSALQSRNTVHGSIRGEIIMSFSCSTFKPSFAVRKNDTHKRLKLQTKLNTASSASRVYHYQ